MEIPIETSVWAAWAGRDKVPTVSNDAINILFANMSFSFINFYRGFLATFFYILLTMAFAFSRAMV